MTETISTAVGCPTERAIVQVLLYFEIFSYPLTAEEVFQFSNCAGTNPVEVFAILQKLVRQGIAFQFDSFFQTTNDISWTLNRIENNRRADQLLPVARRMARLIGAFPFVRGVFVSGSLSKHCMRADSDIDFFIITEPGRLWLARTLLVLFKKIFLFNSHKYFCVNYFVDTEHLEIEEKNQYTATEIVTLLPMYGREWYEHFYRANEWVHDFFPHFPPRPNNETPAHKRGLFKKTAERMLGSRFSEWLDVQAMRLTTGYWKRKFRHFDAHTFDGALKSRRHVSKHHPLYFQKSVLEQYARQISALEARE